jgi:hypothetical protein
LDSRPSEPICATCVHNCVAASPTIGSSATHCGAGGMRQLATLATSAAMSPVWRTMVPTANNSGTTSSVTISSVITSTARARRRHSRASNQRSIGQVDTTIIIAHTVGAMNGRSTHSVATISKPMNSTPSVVRGRSRESSGIGGNSGADCA